MKKPTKTLKSLLIFILVMVVLYFLGLLCGIATARLEAAGTTQTLSAALSDFFTQNGAVLYLVLGGLCLVAEGLLFLHCRREFAALQQDMDNDDLWDRVEQHLNRPMVLANVLTIADVFVFGTLLVFFNDFSNPVNLCALLLSVVFGVLQMVLAHVLVRMEQTLNPEKQGNIFDLNFGKTWLHSAGEAEQRIIWQSGYYAFQVTNITCAVLWLVSFVGMLAFHTGIFAYLLVSLIWVINTAAYSMKGAQLERKG